MFGIVQKRMTMWPKGGLPGSCGGLFCAELAKTLLSLLAALTTAGLLAGVLSPKEALAFNAQGVGNAQWIVGAYEDFYSADGTEAYITASAIVDSRPETDSYRFEILKEGSSDPIVLAGDDINWIVNPNGDKVALRAMVQTKLFGVQEISYRFVCGDEVIFEWAKAQVVSPLALSPSLFVVDEDSMTIVPKNPAGPEGDTTVPALAEEDVRYYATVDGVPVELEEWDSSVPGEHKVYAAAASDNVTGEALLIELTVPEEEPSEEGGSGVVSGTEGEGSSEESTEGSQVPDSPVVTPTPPTPSPSFPAQEERVRFEDVPEGAWFEEAVYAVADEGLMSPVQTTVFGVRDVLTRGEAAQLAMVLFGGVPEEGSAFSDVPADSPYAGAIEWVRACGIMSGYAGTTCFGPDDPLTQEQAAVVLFNVSRYVGDIPGALENDLGILLTVQGGENVSSWAKEAVAWAVRNEWTEILSLNPQGAVTRGEAAVYAAMRSGL